MLVVWEVAVNDTLGVRFCLGEGTPMEVRRGKRKSVAAVDAAEIVDARFDETMGDLCGDGVEEKRYWSDLGISLLR